MASRRAHTQLQDYLSLVQSRPSTRDLPKLPDSLLTRARNSRRHTPNNNDLLEFIGDRCVNLVAALLADRVRIDKVHHEEVRRVVCTNDTFGRLAFCLHLHDHAELDKADVAEVERWNLQSPFHPPKALADLFEAYAGAVFVHHGWKALRRWLELVLEPIIKVATGDYWCRDLSVPLRRFDAHRLKDPRGERMFIDFLKLHSAVLVQTFQPVLETLSLPNAGHETVLAVDLLNMWICKLFAATWPEYHRATSKSAHLATCITTLIVSDVALSCIATSLALDDLVTSRSHEPEATAPPRKLSAGDRSSTSARTVPRRLSGRSKVSTPILSTALKTVVGLYYRHDPHVADTWAESWLTPLVKQAHDILTTDPRHRPVLPRDPDSRRTSSSSSLDDDRLSTLFDGFGALSLSSGGRSTPRESSHSRKGSTSGSIRGLPRVSSSPPSVCERDTASDSEPDVLASLVGKLQSLGLDHDSEKRVSHVAPRPHFKNEGTSEGGDARRRGMENGSSTKAQHSSSRRAAAKSSVLDKYGDASKVQAAPAVKWRPVGRSKSRARGNITASSDTQTEQVFEDSSNSLDTGRRRSVLVSESRSDTSSGRAESPPDLFDADVSGLRTPDVCDSGYASVTPTPPSKPLVSTTKPTLQPPIPPSLMAFVPRQVFKKPTARLKGAASVGREMSMPSH